jgi:hypothetical protein
MKKSKKQRGAKKLTVAAALLSTAQAAGDTSTGGSGATNSNCRT